MNFAISTTWIDLKGTMLSEKTKQRKINTLCYYLYVETKTKQINKYKKAETVADIENKPVVTSGDKGRGKDKARIGD